MTFGFLGADKLVDDKYVLDNAGTTFIGRRKQNRITVGSRLEVVVDKVDRYKRMIDFRQA